MGADLTEILKSRGFVQQPNGEWAKPNKREPRCPQTIASTRGAGALDTERVPAAKLERGNVRKNARTDANEAGSSTCYVVRIISYRSRLIDDDNLCEKFVVDSLRYAGLLPDDRRSQARIVTWQEACSPGEERTEVIIECVRRDSEIFTKAGPIA